MYINKELVTDQENVEGKEIKKCEICNKNFAVPPEEVSTLLNCCSDDKCMTAYIAAHKSDAEKTNDDEATKTIETAMGN